MTFLLRAVFSIIYALANVLQNIGDRPSTDNPCDASCFNVFAIMQAWLELTPEFQLSVELISSPVALLVASWGMTSARTLQVMRRRGGDHVTAVSMETFVRDR